MLRDSFDLAKRIYDSGYRPDLMLALWRGGAPVGMAVHEFFRYKGLEMRHAVLKAESYTGIEERTDPQVEGIDDFLYMLKKDMKVLVVDDISDTGATLKKICELIVSRTRNVKIATLYMKENGALEPDYFLKKVSGWVVFPHEIAGLSPDEIRKKDEFIYRLLE